MTKSKPEFKIESGVPIPPPRSPRYKYPLHELKVTESFFIPASTKGTATGMYVRAQRLGIKVATRVVDGGLRVWRVK